MDKLDGHVITNGEVFERISEKRILWNSIEKRRNEWIGHVQRRGGLLGLIIKSFVEGKNYKGRLRLEYMQQIMRDQAYVETKRKVSNREEWRIATNTKSQD